MKRFEIGQIGEIAPHWFRVLACVTYGNEDGLWDEWCLELHDGSIGWLEEEDGQTFLTRKQRLVAVVPPYENVRVGQMLPVNGQNFFVVEKCRARVMQTSGDLPFPLSSGDAVSFVDGVIEGRPASLEYGEEAIELAIGEVIGRGGILSSDVM